VSAAVRFQDVYRIYDAPGRASVALQGLTLEVAPGELVVVLGPSGAGKSTLLRIAAGLDRPTAGVAEVLGVEPARLRARTAAAFRARELGVLDQHYARSLSPDLTCRATIGLRLDLQGATRYERELRVDELLERVGLADRGGDLPGSLSGGEQQRVAVARAFVTRPQLLLADEPTGNLDGTTGKQVMDLLFELARADGTTLILITHDMALAGRCDRILRIADGLLVGDERLPAALAAQ